MLDAGMMPGSKITSSKGFNFAQQETKLHMLVTGQTWIGSTPLQILLAEIVYYMCLKLVLEVKYIEGYTKYTADLLGIAPVIV